MTGFFRRHPIRPELVRRLVVYGLLILFLVSMQSAFFARLSFLPVTPDLMLGALTAILLFDSRKVAAVVAIVGGVWLDAVGSIGIVWSPVLYLLVVAVVGALSEKMMHGFWSWILLMPASLILRMGFTLMGLMLASDSFAWGAAMRSVLLPEAAETLVIGIPLFFLVCLCSLPLRDPRDRMRR